MGEGRIIPRKARKVGCETLDLEAMERAGLKEETYGDASIFSHALLGVEVNCMPTPRGGVHATRPVQSMSSPEPGGDSIKVIWSPKESGSGVSRNAPPGLMSLIVSLERKSLVEEVTGMEHGFLWCFLRSCFFSQFSKNVRSLRFSSVDALCRCRETS